MKIRTDFVTNSSSSSFVIALGPHLCTIGALQLIARNKRARGTSTLRALDEFYGHYYGEKTDDDQRYNDMKTAIAKGYTILYLDIDYGDSDGAAFFDSLPRVDDGRGYYLLYNSD